MPLFHGLHSQVVGEGHAVKAKLLPQQVQHGGGQGGGQVGVHRLNDVVGHKNSGGAAGGGLNSRPEGQKVPGQKLVQRAAVQGGARVGVRIGAVAGEVL